MPRSWVLLSLGLCHGIGDAAAGYLLAQLPSHTAITAWAPLVLTYNVLAFALQPLVGLWVDRWRLAQPAAVCSPAIAGLALLVGPVSPQIAIVLAGLSSALFHTGAGALALGHSRRGATGLGVFAAPGVVGLTLGGLAGAAGVAPLALLGLLVLSGALLAWIEPTDRHTPRGQAPTRLSLQVAWLALPITVLCIALRSGAWDAVQTGLRGHVALAFPIALAAGLGKAGGGWLADRFGWRRWTVAALASSALLLGLGGQQTASLLVGVALLQSSLPAAAAACATLLPYRPATAAGLALGLGVALGGLPGYFVLIVSGTAPFWTGGLLIAAAAASWVGLRGLKGHNHAIA